MGNKTFWRFTKLFVVIIAIALALGYVAGLFDTSPERGAEEYFADLEAQYENDIYGGDTPEETLALFIDALETGDIELASKYFVIEEQGKWLVRLGEIKEDGLLADMITDLKRDKFKNEISKEQVNFSISNDSGEVALTVLLGRTPNSLWKIIDM